MQSLLEHKCDLAVLFSPNLMPGITSIEVDQSELVMVYTKDSLPGNPTTLALCQLVDFEFIDISDSGPLGVLLWNRMMEENISFASKIKVQTYFIAVRLVAQGGGICVVDKYTAQGNLSDNLVMASFDPPLHFSINLLHLENRPLSKLACAFSTCLTDAISSC